MRTMTGFMATALKCNLARAFLLLLLAWLVN
jgi:hypothetical protein